MFRKTPCGGDNIIRDDIRLKSFILSVYRDVLIKLESNSRQREIVMKRFDYLKDKPKYYWTSLVKIR